jgi:thiamine-phosphate diphosphorylase
VGPVICLVTDRRRLGGHWRDEIVALAREAAEAGVQLIQIREPDLDGGELVTLVRRCLAGIAHTPARVLVNDRLDVALAAGAHGVHLPAHGLPAQRVRAIAPRGFLIGRSVHGVDEGVAAARAGGVDYLIFGTVFATSSKPGVPGLGTGPLGGLASSVPVPVLAIGGVSLGRMPELAEAGAAGFAAIGLFGAGGAELTKLVRSADGAFDRPRSLSYTRSH